MSGIFLSYRRDDTSPYAGRIHDRLIQRFGVDQVFMDIDHIAPGEDFVEAIERSVAAADIVLVMIGPRWLARDGAGGSRLEDPKDFVRLEVCAALQKKIPVIPVLVGGAAVPREEDLPSDLGPLTRRHALAISDERFHTDVSRLIESIEKRLGKDAGRTNSSSTRIPRYALWGIAGAVIAALAAGASLLSGSRETRPETRRAEVSQPTPQRPDLPMKILNIERKIELQGMPFGKAEMTSDNVRELDRFLSDLKPVTVSRIIVTGHTDRTGSGLDANTREAKQRFSERTAKVVRDYIVSQGIDSKLVSSQGAADSKPIPVTKYCSDQMQRKQLIECLAPNRRVTVEALGTLAVEK